MTEVRRGSIESWDSIEGTPAPLGATWVALQHAWNFSLYSRDAAAVTLLIYAADDHVRPLAEVVLDPLVNKTGRIWHCRVGAERVPGAAHYAFRVDGPKLPRTAFRPAKVLTDPFAKRLSTARASAGNASSARRAAAAVSIAAHTASTSWQTCVRIPAACNHAAATAASRPVGVRISTGSSTPVAGGGASAASRLSIGAVSCIRGEARQHPPQLGERFAHANAVRPQDQLMDRVRVPSAPALEHGQRAAHHPPVFKIAKEHDRVGQVGLTGG